MEVCDKMRACILVLILLLRVLLLFFPLHQLFNRYEIKTLCKFFHQPQWCNQSILFQTLFNFRDAHSGTLILIRVRVILKNQSLKGKQLFTLQNPFSLTLDSMSDSWVGNLKFQMLQIQRPGLNHHTLKRGNLLIIINASCSFQKIQSQKNHFKIIQRGRI